MEKAEIIAKIHAAVQYNVVLTKADLVCAHKFLCESPSVKYENISKNKLFISFCDPEKLVAAKLLWNDGHPDENLQAKTEIIDDLIFQAHKAGFYISRLDVVKYLQK
jgi:hypothetical protein